MKHRKLCLAILLGAVLIFGAAGCSNAKDTDAKTQTEAKEEQKDSGQENKETSDKESKKEDTKTDKKEKTSIKHILSQRNFWGIGIARFLADPAWGTINFWVPIFFVGTVLIHRNLRRRTPRSRQARLLSMFPMTMQRAGMSIR